MSAAQSLILKEQADIEEAPFLFPDAELPQIDKTKPKWHCTGTKLFNDRPDVYKAVVRMRAEPGISIRAICRALHVTDDTVRAVIERENIALAAHKKRILSNLTHGLTLASERVIEMMPTASAKDALIGVGILGEKMLLLGGEATARIEVATTVNFHEQFAALHAETMKMIEAIEIDPNTGLDGENAPAKALHAASAAEHADLRATSPAESALAPSPELI